MKAFSVSKYDKLKKGLYINYSFAKFKFSRQYFYLSFNIVCTIATHFYVTCSNIFAHVTTIVNNNMVTIAISTT